MTRPPLVAKFLADLPAIVANRRRFLHSQGAPDSEAINAAESVIQYVRDLEDQVRKQKRRADTLARMVEGFAK